MSSSAIRVPTLRSLLSLLVFALSCSRFTHGQVQPPAPTDPTKAEIALVAKGGFEATLVIDNGSVGIWTCGPCKVFELHGSPDIFGLDDRGRCHVLSGYSGKWAPYQTVEDFEWLGGFTDADVDPRWDHPEFYTGGKRGNLYAVRAHREGGFDTALIARFPGQEIHTLVAADFLPSRPGRELLAFTGFGHVYDVKPKAEPGMSFDAPLLAVLPGRVRDAKLLPGKTGAPARALAVLRSGEVMILSMNEKGLESKVVLEEPMGFGRVALRPGSVEGRVVAYATRDDGVILRLEEQPDGSFTREAIYAGHQGPRGIAAGRFDADPAVETVAIFGYSAKVELLSRKRGEPWRVETIFEDRDKGHWLATLEVDDRNGTDELIASGYGGRIVLLARPAGYGRPGVLTTPAPMTPTAESRPTSKALRVGVRGSAASLPQVSTLSYRGGFEAKAMIYEPLTTRDEKGRIAPGLAEKWWTTDGGRTWTFELRRGATWHDGKPVDADQVRLHMKRWFGLPENDWLGASRFVVDVRVEGSSKLVFELSRPWALPEELCVINPGGIVGPGSRDREGNFLKPIGSGRFAHRGVDAARGALLLTDTRTQRDVDLIYFDGRTPARAADALRRGEIDLFFNGWARLASGAELKELARDERFRVETAGGSSVLWLVPNARHGVFRDAASRRRFAQAVDRGLLASAAPDGRARPSPSLFAPSIEDWPVAAPSQAATDASESPAATPVVIDVATDDEMQSSVARSLAAMLENSGFTVTIAERSPGERPLDGADLRFVTTWGVPYDPFVTLASYLGRRPAAPNAVQEPPVVDDDRLAALVDAATGAASHERLVAAYAAIQNHIDVTNLVIPLIVEDRVAIARRDAPKIKLTHDLYRFDVVTP